MTSDFTVHMDEYLPLREVVFNTLRQAILKGELKPGERLMEIALAEKLGVSRTPIREAMRKLELEGLVVMIPRRGAQVANITEKDLNDVLEVRITLENMAIEKACANMTDADIRKLEQAAEVFQTSTAEGDLVKMAEADVNFHEVIYEAADNKRGTRAGYARSAPRKPLSLLFCPNRLNNSHPLIFQMFKRQLLCRFHVPFLNRPGNFLMLFHQTVSGLILFLGS